MPKESIFHHAPTRVLIAALVALVVVLGGIFAALSYLSSQDSSDVRPASTYTDEEKLHILSSLKTLSSVATEGEKRDAVDALRSEDDTRTEAEKLDVLRALRTL